MNAQELRKSFLDFFASKQHKIVPSAPMVIKNDPTLMFTNAGMNQFKDYFLGNSPIKHSRVTDSQKCLRVSGKHNDLEEVGHDTYHHTMFEMLGNWSFGDYFKKEAIDYAWEYLVNTLNVTTDRLYATVFGGCSNEKLESDEEARNFWKKYLPENRILDGSRKDNFWEMGETGPCGPCSEIHIDLRDDEERKKLDGKKLVNEDHPLVIEIWNLVFIQYNRKANGTLEPLPAKHVDTGMGFERLAMVVQGKKSNYDTDVFQPIIQTIGKIANKEYGKDIKDDIAMRVISDHLRTIAFAIADGQLPSNNKAGYVIRRILRRSVRYAYTFLNISEPFMAKLMPVLIEGMGGFYPELKAQRDIIEKVITEEEQAFLRTLETGIRLLDNIIEKTKKENKTEIDGKVAFELYDTYGFPHDLTALILKEQNLTLNEKEFKQALEEQKKRSRKDASVETGDWTELKPTEEVEFIGYDSLEADNINIIKYRPITRKKKKLYQIVFNKTPFYAESGGQVGDNGLLIDENDKIKIIDTQKENNLIIHITEKLPANLEANFSVTVNSKKRNSTANNHTATHLLQNALCEVLGNHIEQKGSLVNEERLRFDFSHFQKMSDEEIAQVEEKVNAHIRKNITCKAGEYSIQEAENMGAIALFGEKYGETVRVVKFDNSIEFCGGTHVENTGQIGLFKIVSEGAIAAGIRRVEAVTSQEAEKFINNQLNLLKEIKGLFKNSTDLKKNIETLIAENANQHKQIAAFEKQKLQILKKELLNKVESKNGLNFIGEKIDLESPAAIKDLAFQLKQMTENLVLVLGAEVNEKANLTIMISDNLVKDNDLNAGKIIREIAKEIQGGGGGQAFFATAGGKNPKGLEKAISKAKEIILG